MITSKLGSIIAVNVKLTLPHYPSQMPCGAQGTYIEAEGLKRRKFWTLNVFDSAGVSLIRLSTESQSDYAHWLDALEQAGCERVRGGGGWHCMPLKAFCCAARQRASCNQKARFAGGTKQDSFLPTHRPRSGARMRVDAVRPTTCSA